MGRSHMPITTINHSWVPVNRNGVALPGIDSRLWFLLVSRFCDYGFTVLRISSSNAEALRLLASEHPEYSEPIKVMLDAIAAHGEIDILDHWQTTNDP